MAALAIGAAIFLLALGLASLAGAIAARGAAQSAADLAALAGAEKFSRAELRGLGQVQALQEACGVAEETAARNSAHLDRCRLAGVRTVEVETSRAVNGWGSARAAARAGPRP